MSTITWQDFEKIDMRVGTILAAEENKGAVKALWPEEIYCIALSQESPE
jgi:tRNA-binding EMAP/Myf-like protein